MFQEEVKKMRQYGTIINYDYVDTAILKKLFDLQIRLSQEIRQVKVAMLEYRERDMISDLEKVRGIVGKRIGDMIMAKSVMGDGRNSAMSLETDFSAKLLVQKMEEMSRFLGRLDTYKVKELAEIKAELTKIIPRAIATVQLAIEMIPRPEAKEDELRRAA
jgi:hypothetical protein